MNHLLDPIGSALPTPPAACGDTFEHSAAVLRWAHARFGSGLCVTASFGDATLPHFVDSVLPGIEITLLDTGYLFAETDWFVDHLRHRFELDIRVVRPDPELARDVWATDTDACCAARKVEPLERALDGRTAWVTGLRRADSDQRIRTPTVHNDLLRAVTKINPLAAWTDDDVATYARRNDLPEHPLADRGYSSIGCWPCTRPAADRSGRWADSDKTECGLHH